MLDANNDMKNKPLILLIFFFIFFPTNLVMAQTKGGSLTNELISDIKKTVVFLGDFKEKNEKKQTRIKATGFLVEIKNIFHLVTAKHVIMEVKN